MHPWAFTCECSPQSTRVECTPLHALGAPLHGYSGVYAKHLPQHELSLHLPRADHKVHHLPCIDIKACTLLTLLSAAAEVHAPCAPQQLSLNRIPEASKAATNVQSSAHAKGSHWRSSNCSTHSAKFLVNSDLIQTNQYYRCNLLCIE